MKKLDVLVKKMETIAKSKPVKIVVCEGWDERCIEAAADILKKEIAGIVLLGNPNEINSKAKKLGFDVSKAKIVDFMKNEKLRKELAEKLVEVRKHKGMDLKTAMKLMDDHNYFACMYTLAGHADGVAGSAITSTGALMKPALQILRKPDSMVSEVCVLSDVKNDRIIFGSDFSMGIKLSSEQLAQVTLSAVKVVKMFDIEPRVAMLSFSTKGSGGEGPEIQLIRNAMAIVKEKNPELLIDGELQVDAAVSEFGMKKKCPDSPLKGNANTLIFPDLTSSNIFAHGLGQFSNMTLDFSILEGMQKPVGIVGRSTPAKTVRDIIISCAMQSNAEK
ncbi:MAG: phosphate acyltransferase [archaeon]